MQYLVKVTAVGIGMLCMAVAFQNCGMDAQSSKAANGTTKQSVDRSLDVEDNAYKPPASTANSNTKVTDSFLVLSASRQACSGSTCSAEPVAIQGTQSLRLATDGKYSGTTVCNNNFGGNYLYDSASRQIQFETGTKTQASCAQADSESLFITLLMGATQVAFPSAVFMDVTSVVSGATYTLRLIRGSVPGGTAPPTPPQTVFKSTLSGSYKVIGTLDNACGISGGSSHIYATT